MATYQLWIWVTPNRPVSFPDVHASSYKEAWTKVSANAPRHTVYQSFEDHSAILIFAGNNGRVYRRRAKLKRV